MWRPHLALLALALGCGPAAAGTGPTDADLLVEAFARETGEELLDCGTVTCGNQPPRPGGDEPPLVCLEEAFASCTPARLRYTAITVEGDPIHTHVFVRPAGDGCEVAVLVDATEDCFGARELTRTTCASVAVGPGTGACDNLSFEGCTAPEVLYTAPEGEGCYRPGP